MPTHLGDAAKKWIARGTVTLSYEIGSCAMMSNHIPGSRHENHRRQDARTLFARFLGQILGVCDDVVVGLRASSPSTPPTWYTASTRFQSPLNSLRVFCSRDGAPLWVRSLVHVSR